MHAHAVDRDVAHRDVNAETLKDAVEKRRTGDRSISLRVTVVFPTAPRMIAEWATGRYPFTQLYSPSDGVMTAQHGEIAAPRPLRELLERTIRLDRDERPRLAELIDCLERLGV